MKDNTTYEIQVCFCESEGWETIWSIPGNRITIQELTNTLKAYRKAHPNTKYRLTKFEILD